MITLGQVGTTIEDRLILGDVSALEDMYGRHSALIHAITGVLDTDSRDRLTASAFVDAWEARREFDPSRGSVQAWLVRLVRRSLPMGSESERRVDELVVAGTIAGMDDVQRQILIEGSSASGQTEDLAERLDLPVGTVESHLRRGIRQLQSELVDSRDDGDDSRLAAIIRSGRLEAKLARPSDDVWSQIVQQTGADEAVPMAATEVHSAESPGIADEPPWADLDDSSTDRDETELGNIDADADDYDDDVGKAGGAGLGLVDEFSTTEFPGREMPRSAILDGDVGDGADLAQTSSFDDASLNDDDSDVEGDVPYVLSGNYRPGVDDDPYADRAAMSPELATESRDDESLADGLLGTATQNESSSDGTEAAEQNDGDRLAQAESTYFSEENRPDEDTLALQRRPWARIAIVVVAAVLLVAIVMSLG